MFRCIPFNHLFIHSALLNTVPHYFPNCKKSSFFLKVLRVATGMAQFRAHVDYGQGSWSYAPLIVSVWILRRNIIFYNLYSCRLSPPFHSNLHIIFQCLSNCLEDEAFMSGMGTYGIPNVVGLHLSSSLTIGHVGGADGSGLHQDLACHKLPIFAAL